MTEKINQPSHYTGISGLTARHVIFTYRLGFDLGNAVKYILRGGRKDVDPREDWHKAINYLRYAAQMARDLSHGFPHSLRPTPAEVAEDFKVCSHRQQALAAILRPAPGPGDCLGAILCLEHAIEAYTAAQLPAVNSGRAA